MPFYTKNYKLNTKEFPKNSSENILDIYFNFNYINSSSININYFNENYTSFYIYNPNIDNITYRHISFDIISEKKFVLFLQPHYLKFNSSINIVEFDFKSEEKLKINKIYSFKTSMITNVHCVPIDKNKFMCGLIEFNFTITNGETFLYSLIYFSDMINSPKNISISYQTRYSIEKDSKTGFLKENFIKLIPLSEEKIIYCFNEIILGGSIIKCGLVQIKNNEIKVNSPIVIFQFS